MKHFPQPIEVRDGIKIYEGSHMDRYCREFSRYWSPEGHSTEKDELRRQQLFVDTVHGVLYVEPAHRFNLNTAVAIARSRKKSAVIVDRLH